METKPIDAPKKLTIKGHEDEYIRFDLEGQKTGEKSAKVTVVFKNKVSSEISNLKLLISTMPYIKMESGPISGTMMPPLSQGLVRLVR